MICFVYLKGFFNKKGRKIHISLIYYFVLNLKGEAGSILKDEDKSRKFEKFEKKGKNSPGGMPQHKWNHQIVPFRILPKDEAKFRI